jgi:hypothetical protein
MGHRMGRGATGIAERNARQTVRANSGWRRSLRVAVGFLMALIGAFAALYVAKDLM